MKKKTKKKIISFMIIATVSAIGYIKSNYIPLLEASPTTATSTTTTTTSQSTTTSSDTETIYIDDNMYVHFIDVGQADAILICSDGSNLLIDAGNNADEELMVSYINSLDITSLDYVVGTHPHEDHVGGLDSVIDNFDVSTVILPDIIHDSKTFESVIESIDEKGLSITSPNLGDTYELGDAYFTIITPTFDYEDELNNWSVGIQVVHDENTFLFTGDAEEEAEENILETNIDIQSDVFKAGHHGSTTSNTDEFLDAIDPQYTVIMAGEDNSYGHPHDEILEAFEERNIAVYRTDLNGTIIATSDGETITWVTEK